MPVKALSVQPLYQQVRDLLVERISKGVWKPGTSLPNEHDLARELGISTGTVRKALDSLERDRLVLRQRGRGTFVVDQGVGEPAIRFSNIRDASGRRVLGDMVLIDQKVGDANEAERQRLRLAQDSRVLRTTQLRHLQARPFMFENTVIALDRIPGFDGAGAGTYRISALAQRHGVHLSRASERLSMTRATPEAASHLAVAPATPLIRLDRVIFDMEDNPVEWRVGCCHLSDGCVYAAEMA